VPDFVSQRRPARSGVQVVVNEDNIVDVQADYDGPGAPPVSVRAGPRLAAHPGRPRRARDLTRLRNAQRGRHSRAACSA